MTNEKQQVGRLAMRVEGEWWVAYYATTDSMKEALELGRIRMPFVQDWQRKEIFMAMMRDAASDILKEVTGVTPEWGGPVRAPEHERAGRA